MIEIRPAIGKGRGVFATQAIKPLTVVCEAPVTSMPPGALDGTPLESHCWVHHDGRDYITWGMHSLLNHSDDPNCIAVLHKETDMLISIRAIEDGDELTVDYRGFT